MIFKWRVWFLKDYFDFSAQTDVKPEMIIFKGHFWFYKVGRDFLGGGGQDTETYGKAV